MLLDPLLVVVLVLFPPVIELFMDLSTNDGKNGSAVGKNGVVPLMFAINDRVRLKGMIVRVDDDLCGSEKLLPSFLRFDLGL